jgi:hypothetical protein
MNLHTKLVTGLLTFLVCAAASDSFAAAAHPYQVGFAAQSLNSFSSMTFAPNRAANLGGEDSSASPAEPELDDRTSLQNAASFEDVERAEPLLASGESGRRPVNAMAELFAGLSLLGFVFARRARLL